MDVESEVQDSSKIDTAIPRQLVLDYLLHNCYGETARAFMKDDLDAVKDTDMRKSAASARNGGSSHHNVRFNGSNGNSNGTTSNGTSKVYGSRSGSNGITTAKSDIQGGLMTRNASDVSQWRTDNSASSMMDTENEGALDHEGDSPMAESFLDSSDSLSPSTFTADKAHALQIDEQLKNLETRKAIRSLISHGNIGPAMELCSTAFPGVLSIDLNSHRTTTESIRLNFRLQCQKFIEMVKSDPERGPEALMFAQGVLLEFTHLDPSGKEYYMKQMEEIVSVIAYSNPEESPNGHHLKQEARDHLADVMNSAVLGCNGMSCEPVLLTIVKQATLVRDILSADATKTKLAFKVAIQENNHIESIKQPNIPVRIPNDDSTFDPKECPNVVFEAKGKLTGKIRLIHGTSGSNDSGLGLITTRIWVVNERDKELVVITPTYNENTYIFHLETPGDRTFDSIYHETTIQYPRSTKSVQSLSVSAPNTSLTGYDLQNIFFGSIKSALTNGAISLQAVNSEVVQLRTTNGSISGEFKVGHIDLGTSNGAITSKINVRDAQDGRQSVVSTKTNNGPINAHVTAMETARGLWMENTTRNGNLTVAALVGKAGRASYINATTENSKIDFNVDAKHSDQPLTVINKTSNASIVSSIMVPVNQPMNGVAESSNGSINVSLTEDFQGTFQVDTSNASAIVEGSDVTLEYENKHFKRGHRGQGLSDVKVHSSNGSTGLRFYPSALEL
ncbi:Ran-binding protein 9 [Mortierella polycephala]|uniref:Ran-binding protein 9 n=1 Tax=Mortierella polycephala TaxID=41804 RepID=A0A9P6U8W0_9FUNG|nr:Ran-binding protein 9 [Mortierella polycephala]